MEPEDGTYQYHPIEFRTEVQAFFLVTGVAFANIKVVNTTLSSDSNSPPSLAFINQWLAAFELTTVNTDHSTNSNSEHHKENV